jgi:hypothetical protein
MSEKKIERHYGGVSGLLYGIGGKLKVSLIPIHNLQYLLHTSTQLIFHLMIPKAEYCPSCSLIKIVDLPVPLHISFNLGNPKVPVAFDTFLPVLPIVPMPKGSVHKDQQLILDQAYVGFAGKLSGVAAIADPCMP